jgi:hypothetical protein
MTVIITAGKFPTGRIVMTPGAMAELPQDEAARGLMRHVSGDWGDLDQHDRMENEAALEHGFRLFSSYVTASGTKFYVITEYDRSVTTILLPEEY